MSIRQQVEDARFLMENGRYLGALTVLMLAIAASSKKCFPKGTKSIEKPKEEMKDGDAFSLFLGGRIMKLLFKNQFGPEFGNSGINVPFRGKQFDISYILYKYYRCELTHAGDLPEDVEFAPPGQAKITIVNGIVCGYNVAISCGTKMILDYGWINILIDSVVFARCNGAEFGIKHLNMVPKFGIDENIFQETTVAKYSITIGRFIIMKTGAYLITPEVVKMSNDGQLVDYFLNLVHSGQINYGAVTGLTSHELADGSGHLSSKGIGIIREIAAAYILVEV